MHSLQPVFAKNDRLAYFLIVTFSVVVFAVVSLLSQYHLKLNAGFDVHVFAKINAVINATVSILLVYGLYLVKQGKLKQHKNVMITALILSVLFLLSYIAHHLLAGDARHGGHGIIHVIYLLILSTHILLAGVIMPVVLFAAYRALSGAYAGHKKIARWAWPIWLYVSVTGVIVYFMISPYYV